MSNERNNKKKPEKIYSYVDVNKINCEYKQIGKI